MDQHLARRGGYPAWLVMGAGFVLGGEGEHRPLLNGVANLVGFAAAPFALRGAALRRGWPRRGRVALAHRVALAVAYAGVAGWFAQWHYDVPWFSVVHGALSGAAAAYATRPPPVSEGGP